MLSVSVPVFAEDEVVVVRKLSQRVVLTNAPIEVTVTVTNRGSNVLRGFTFSEQVPVGLTVSNLGIKINGAPALNGKFEVGEESAVYPLRRPYRWRFETPTNFSEANFLSGQSSAEIRYQLSCPAKGSFELRDYSWVAWSATGTNGLFGLTSVFEVQPLKFVEATGQPLVSYQHGLDLGTLAVDGVPGTPYVLATSSNLVDWLPVSTNLTPFFFYDFEISRQAQKFYRATPYVMIGAAVELRYAGESRCFLSINGVAGCAYILEKSLDLFSWAPLGTNHSPFTVFDVNPPGCPAAFYRARRFELP